MRLALALCLAPLAAFPARAQPPADTLVVVVRVDDVQSRSALAPRSLGPFEAAAEARGAKVSWLVIPARLAELQHANGVLAAELRASAARGHEVGVHGFNHICTRCGGTDHEMWCARDRVAHGEAKQSKWLDDGLALLRDRVGVVPASFVAPGHHADAATHRLLAARGMRTVSTHAAAEDSLAPGQTNLRTSDDFSWGLTASTYAARRADALRDARTRGRRQGYYVLLLHDPFTRPGYADGLVARWTGEVLDSLRAEHPVRFETMAGAAAYLARRATPAERPTAAPALALTAAPNPASGRSTLRFTLPQGADVTLAVYDALGRRVALLADGPFAPGPHAAVWEAGTAPPGVYLYRLTAGAATRTGTLTVAR